MSGETPEPCSTLDEFILDVVVKELRSAQELRRPNGGRPLALDRARALLGRLAPDLCADLLDAVRGWMPAVAETSPSTLLPDLDNFPASAQDAEGLSVKQRKLLLGAVEIIFDSFGTQLPAKEAATLVYPLFPRPSIACIAAQVGAVFEHLQLLRPHAAEAHVRAHELDVADWQRVHNASRNRPQAGSKQELIEELQLSHQHVFDLERELQTQAKITEVHTNRGKRECDKAVGRLLEVNSALAEKLKQRTEEHNQVSSNLLALERRVEHARWLTEQKSHRVAELEAEVKHYARLQDDMLMREREYGKRIIRLRLEEFQGLCRDNMRMKRYSQAISAGDAENMKQAILNQKDLSELALSTLNEVEAEFDKFFEEREHHIAEVAHSSDDRFSARLSVGSKRADGSELCNLGGQISLCSRCRQQYRPLSAQHGGGASFLTGLPGLQKDEQTQTSPNDLVDLPAAPHGTGRRARGSVMHVGRDGPGRSPQRKARHTLASSPVPLLPAKGRHSMLVRSQTQSPTMLSPSPPSSRGDGRSDNAHSLGPIR